MFQTNWNADTLLELQKGWKGCSMPGIVNSPGGDLCSEGAALDPNSPPEGPTEGEAESSLSGSRDPEQLDGGSSDPNSSLCPLEAHTNPSPNVLKITILICRTDRYY